MEEPQAVEAGLAGLIPGQTLLAGTIERRLLVTGQPDVSGWTVADLSGQPLGSWPWPAWTEGRIQLDRPGSWLSTASITDDGVSRLLRPRVLLVALYCCPALKMSTKPALMVRMCGCEKTPLGGCLAGSWCSRCRLGVQSAVTSATAARVEDSSTMDLLAVNAATRDWMARLLTERG